MGKHVNLKDLIMTCVCLFLFCMLFMYLYGIKHIRSNKVSLIFQYFTVHYSFEFCVHIYISWFIVGFLHNLLLFFCITSALFLFKL